jgi:hypothetical protein
MTTEKLREVHRAQPFQPFTLHLADGRSLHVPHPEWFWMHPKGGRIAVVVRDRSFDLVDLLLVSSVEVESSAA